MTAEEYYEVTVEGDRTQLVGGEVNDPKLEDVRPQNSLLFELTNWARAAPGRGAAFLPTDMIIDVELELSGADQLTSPLLPDFSVQVERLFRR
jgi:hypothetical protein